MTNTCDAISNSDRCQASTGMECTITNTCDAISNSERCQACTGMECTNTNTCDAIWNSDRCQATTGSECMITNTCDAISNSDRYQACTGIECTITNICDAIWNSDRCQATTGFECPTINTCDAIWNSDRCQVSTGIECTIINFRPTSRYIHVTIAIWLNNTHSIQFYTYILHNAPPQTETHGNIANNYHSPILFKYLIINPKYTDTKSLSSVCNDQMQVLLLQSSDTTHSLPPQRRTTPIERLEKSRENVMKGV